MGPNCSGSDGSASLWLAIGTLLLSFVAYEYDSTGNRVASTVTTDESGTAETTRTEYLTDDANHTGYSQVLQQTTFDDQGTATGKVIYTIGHDQISQTRSQRLADGVFWSAEATDVFVVDGHGSVRMLLDGAADVVVDTGNRSAQQVYQFDAYGNLLNFASGVVPLTAYLYSGESFDFNIGQQYLRARWYDATTGRFNRLDPFAGNASDPQSFHKYAYVHGDPVNGVDPSGLFLTGVWLRAKHTAQNLAAYASIKAQILLWQTYSRLSLAYNGLISGWGAYVAYHGMNFAARFPTWIPRIEMGLDILELGLMTLDGMSDRLRSLADGIDNIPSDTVRGEFIEIEAGANLAGWFKGIDDIRYIEGTDRVFVTSVRSHDVATPESLLKAIRNDLNDLYDKSRKPMFGVDKDGVYRRIVLDDSAGRGLLVAIPSSRSGWVPQITSAIRDLADGTECIVRVVAIPKWRGRVR